jgi:hypothetical protein
MNNSPQILVTMSDSLFRQLRKGAREQHIPLPWVVAGFVCDLNATWDVPLLVNQRPGLTAHARHGRPVSRRSLRQG